eukprot:537667-Rhodomonas_salina.3
MAQSRTSEPLAALSTGLYAWCIRQAHNARSQRPKPAQGKTRQADAVSIHSCPPQHQSPRPCPPRLARCADTRRLDGGALALALSPCSRPVSLRARVPSVDSTRVP